MTISRNISVMAQGASSSGILAGGYGGLGASLSPTTAGNTIFTTDGTNWSSTQKIVRGTAVATTSGTTIDFSGIPSWVKRLTIMFQGVSTNSTSNKLMQLGTSSGIENTGYTSTSTALGAGITNAASTAGFLINSGGATEVLSGIIVIDLISGTTFVLSGTLASGSAASWICNGYKTLASALTTFRLTTVNGTDTFDAGSVNILYE